MRRADWEQRLADYLGKHRKAVFDYGKLDCVLFAAGAIRALTGKDHAKGIRGRYDTAIGAVRVLHAEGYESLSEMMDDRFGTVPNAHAQRGDIVLANGSLGVCVGRTAVFIGDEGGRPGLVSVPMRDAEIVWRIPFAGEVHRRD